MNHDVLLDRIERLELRLRAVEDEQEISQLVAAYGPLVDAGEAEMVADLWTEDGIYDVDEISMAGRDQIRAMVRSKNHQGWIAGGCAHFLGPVRVQVTGDEAVAVCHSLMIVNQGGAFEEAPEFVVRRATAHHFEVVRTAEGWRVAKRTSRVLDGRDEAPALLVRGAKGEPA
ncbi:nuclear transport factor 2 family protein [Nocardioides sp. JQ2195]|uniref:nuclear transport factor 2 family protein n=1 Tax=Nocardioides sp. JQ2195 TaxID=2592334 RepID=UPI00143EDE8B|nr:nuclear transport factor 2 family protein [Nocardioides sp. JQ2195]QIX25610.1 nuclear transport factor 2 family protein [Nocardioides sp. JQ2195]